MLNQILCDLKQHDWLLAIVLPTIIQESAKLLEKIWSESRANDSQDQDTKRNRKKRK